MIACFSAGVPSTAVYFVSSFWIARMPACLTFSGVGIYRAELFEGCRDGIFKLAPLLRAAARDGRVSGEIHAGAWLDIGTPERLAELDMRLRGGGR